MKGTLETADPNGFTALPAGMGKKSQKETGWFFQDGEMPSGKGLHPAKYALQGSIIEGMQEGSLIGRGEGVN